MENSDQNPAMEKNFLASLRDAWYWFLIIGIVFIIGGILAFFNPVASSLAIEIVIGVTFLVVGIIRIFQAFRYKTDWGTNFWLFLLLAILELILGVLLLQNPLAGLLSLTFIAGILIAASGILKFIMALQIKPLDGWIWMLMSGIVSLILAVLIFWDFGESFTFTLGVLLGAVLLSDGIFLIIYAFTVKNLPRL